MKVVLLVSLLAACDALDGHIDDPSNCCEAVFDVRGCLEQHVQPGYCLDATCPTDDAVVCRLLDGGLTDHPEDLKQ